ncbi:MAG: hypothetical protein WKF96_16195 [Solirubrobacteraceae bacterium]
MRADIEAAMTTIPKIVRATGPFAKSAKAIEHVVGSSEVLAVTPVWPPPASVREKMFGTTSEKLSLMADEMKVYALVLTDSEVLEVRAQPRLKGGGADVNRIPLRSITSVDYDSPRLAQTLGAKVHLIFIQSRNGDSIVCKAGKGSAGPDFVAAVERQRGR